MIKVHLLERIIETVTTVGKKVAGRKEKKEVSIQTTQTVKEEASKQLHKEVIKGSDKKAAKEKLPKENIFKSIKEKAHDAMNKVTGVFKYMINRHDQVEDLHIKKEKAINKTTLMKRWLRFIEMRKMILLENHFRGNQQQRLYSRDNVVYIDFDSTKHKSLKTCYRMKKDTHQQKYGIKACCRAPTYKPKDQTMSYIFYGVKT